MIFINGHQLELIRLQANSSLPPCIVRARLSENRTAHGRSLSQLTRVQGEKRNTTPQTGASCKCNRHCTKAPTVIPNELIINESVVHSLRSVCCVRKGERC